VKVLAQAGQVNEPLSSCRSWLAEGDAFYLPGSEQGVKTGPANSRESDGVLNIDEFRFSSANPDFSS
jgi:hypothetical protein